MFVCACWGCVYVVHVCSDGVTTVIGGDVALSRRDRSHERRGSESIGCNGSCRRNWRSEATTLVLQEGSRGWVIGGIGGFVTDEIAMEDGTAS